MSSSGIFKFKDSKTYPDPFLEYNPPSLGNKDQEKPAIIIDNGKILAMFSISLDMLYLLT